MTKKTTKAIPFILDQKNFQRMRVENLNVSPHASRKHSLKKIEKIASSLSQFGWLTPILIGPNKEVICGHARLEAAKQLGIEHAPVILITHLNEAEIRAYRILDNRLAEDAEWDLKQLASEFSFLYAEELAGNIEFDLSITGFDTGDIDSFLFPSSQEINFIEGDDTNPLIDKPAICKPFDLWLCGSHRIYCADSQMEDSYIVVMDGLHAHVLCVDPPYNVKIDGFVSGKGKIKHREFSQASGEMSAEQFIIFLARFMKFSVANLSNGALSYIFMDWRHDKELQKAAQSCALTQINLCVWDKGAGGMGSLYRSQHELVFVYRHGKAAHKNNVMLGKHGRNRTNVWHYPGANMSAEGRKALNDHPTPKPVPLILDILKDCTKVNDIVLDPFLGSGTTLLAAERSNRICHGIEIDPHYVDVCIRRWQELAGEDAIHAQTGMTFLQHQQSQNN